MGLGWIQTQPHTQEITFSGYIEHQPSSTKAEVMAILTAIVTCPPNCNINIFTDSQNCISTYSRFSSTATSSIRQMLKINNHSIWQCIKIVQARLNLTITLHKVKGHSNDIYNDAADALAKAGWQNPHTLSKSTLNSSQPASDPLIGTG